MLRALGIGAGRTSESSVSGHSSPYGRDRRKRNRLRLGIEVSTWVP